MKFAGLILICVFFGSCLNDGNCLITSTNNIHIQFKKESNHKLDTALVIKTISISGTDSIIKVNTSASEVLIPIDIHSNTTSIVIRHTNSDSTNVGLDTLQVSYTGQSKVIAKDCGAFTYYQNLEMIKTNLKDSQIKIFSTSLLKDPTLGNTPSAYAVNYQIFY
jgi:hypothetical protein